MSGDGAGTCSTYDHGEATLKAHVLPGNFLLAWGMLQWPSRDGKNKKCTTNITDLRRTMENWGDPNCCIYWSQFPALPWCLHNQNTVFLSIPWPFCLWNSFLVVCISSALALIMQNSCKSIHATSCGLLAKSTKKTFNCQNNLCSFFPPGLGISILSETFFILISPHSRLHAEHL